MHCQLSFLSIVRCCSCACTHLVLLELLVHLQALLLLHAAVDAHAGEVALVEQRVERAGARHTLDKDHHLGYGGHKGVDGTGVSGIGQRELRPRVLANHAGSRETWKLMHPISGDGKLHAKNPAAGQDRWHCSCQPLDTATALKGIPGGCLANDLLCRSGERHRKCMRKKMLAHILACGWRTPAI